MKGFTQYQSSAKRAGNFTMATMLSKCSFFGAGFTLIETMIAITILTTAVAGPLFVADRAIVAAQISRDQLTALYLAQEGIEYLRAMRDNEFLRVYALHGPNVSVDAWSAFLTGDVGDVAAITPCRATAANPTNACSLDLSRGMGYGSGAALFQCGPLNSCAKLFLLPGGGYISNRSVDIGSAAPTAFSRTIKLVDLPAPSDASTYPDKRAVSTVTWDFHGTHYAVTINVHLTPWQ